MPSLSAAAGRSRPFESSLPSLLVLFLFAVPPTTPYCADSPSGFPNPCPARTRTFDPVLLPFPDKGSNLHCPLAGGAPTQFATTRALVFVRCCLNGFASLQWLYRSASAPPSQPFHRHPNCGDRFDNSTQLVIQSAGPFFDGFFLCRAVGGHGTVMEFVQRVAIVDSVETDNPVPPSWGTGCVQPAAVVQGQNVTVNCDLIVAVTPASTVELLIHADGRTPVRCIYRPFCDRLRSTANLTVTACRPLFHARDRVGDRFDAGGHIGDAQHFDAGGLFDKRGLGIADGRPAMLPSLTASTDGDALSVIITLVGVESTTTLRMVARDLNDSSSSAALSVPVRVLSRRPMPLWLLALMSGGGLLLLVLLLVAPAAAWRDLRLFSARWRYRRLVKGRAVELPVPPVCLVLLGASAAPADAVHAAHRLLEELGDRRPPHFRVRTIPAGASEAAEAGRPGADKEEISVVLLGPKTLLDERCVAQLQALMLRATARRIYLRLVPMQSLRQAIGEGRAAGLLQRVRLDARHSNSVAWLGQSSAWARRQARLCIQLARVSILTERVTKVTAAANPAFDAQAP